MKDPQMEDPRLVAGFDLLRRTGAKSVTIRCDEPEREGDPVVWMALVEWNLVEQAEGWGKPVPEWEDTGQTGYEVAAAFHPLKAIMRLCALVLDQSKCAHCQRDSMFDENFGETLLEDVFCWYQWDPELKTFRRSCEGDEGPYQKTGRNDECPCGSGKKFKRCHGG